MLTTYFKSKKSIRRWLLVLVVALTPNLFVIAQPGDPGDDPDNPVPITGIELLVAAGALLGFKKLRDRNKR